MWGNSFKQILHQSLLLILVCTGMGLAGCSSTPRQGDSSITGSDTQALLAQAETQLKLGEFGNAALQLQQLSERDMSPAERTEYVLLETELHLAQQDSMQAGYYLEQYQTLQEHASLKQEQRAGLLKAQWYELNQEYLAAARERDFLSGILTDEQKAKNHEQIWQDLMQLSEQQLAEQAQKSAGTQFGGWLELAALSKNTRLTLDEQVSGVKQWQQRHSGHPAEQRLPGGLTLLEDIASKRPTDIALLLPLSGPLGKTGRAVRDGFMASYYQSLQRGYDTPAVKIYDSQQYTTIDDAYRAAQMNGAQWLIGPFNKLQVQALQQRDTLPLPTLALNYGERRQSSEEQGLANNLYQFGLAAEDEAEQVAERAWRDGYRRALVLIPKGDWGKRIFSAFEQRWKELGGEIGGHRYYQARRDYNPDIKALLNVNDSQARYASIRRLMRETTEFEPRRRQDVDWVFMVALPKQARQIKPTLAFNFAGDLPVYSTSHVFSGVVNRNKDRDLNGVRFCDAPWLLEKSGLYDTLENNLSSGQGPYVRLYAMGVDAFRLLPRLRQLEAFPYSRVFGSTGALFLDTDRRIHRQTQCTRFVSGRPKRLAGQ